MFFKIKCYLELCNSSIFYTYFDVNYGKCFRFNSGLNSLGNKIPIFLSRKPGKRNGLRIDLFIGTNFDSDDSTGINIRIHNKTLEPSYNEGVDISPGKVKILICIVIIILTMDYESN